MDRRAGECSGCMACKTICPRDCIKIKTDRIGNFIRVIDTDVCINCGRCEKVCPHKGPYYMENPKRAYAAWSRKRERPSSSGGVAASIYRYCLSHQIECVGVKYDKDFIARYCFLRSEEDIAVCAGSKYVHSNMGRIYKKVEARLRAGKKVVFIGLPCHAAALRNLIGREEPRLLCVDLVCHGVPNKRFLAEHMDFIRKKIKDTTIQSISFREKGNYFFGFIVRGGG